MKKLLWIVVIALVAFAVKVEVLDKNKATNVEKLKLASPAQVESTLGITLTSCPDMAENVYEYSKSGNVTVEGNAENGIGVVYIGGGQYGLRIENKQYTMFGITIGKSRVGLDSAMTYPYEEKFEIGEEVEKELFGKKKDFPVFYCNWTNNDCVVISCEKSTGNVVAVTYFNNARKVTERLKR